MFTNSVTCVLLPHVDQARHGINKLKRWRMASSLVMILLLDTLPGDIRQLAMNELFRTMARDFSLEDMFINDTRVPKHHSATLTHSKQCHRQRITDVLINVINHQINTRIIPKWDSDFDNDYFVYKMKPAYIETPMKEGNLQSLIDNSIEDNFSVQDIENEVGIGSEDMSECDILRKYGEDILKDNANDYINIKDIEENDVGLLARTVPSLVAIFESRANVTAQTCGGVAVAPRWVLTAASCVDVLSNVYNTTTKSHYSVIANAENPLIDGSLHNVTEIIVHPDPTPSKNSLLGLIKHLHHTIIKKKEFKDKTPTLALMRVEPEMETDRLEFMEKRIGEGIELMVYGWVLPKNETFSRSMRSLSFPARTLNQQECKDFGGVEHPVLCLFREGESRDKLEMMTGAPVLGVGGGRAQLVAVAQMDERAPLAAHPLVDHLAWIRKVISVK